MAATRRAVLGALFLVLIAALLVARGGVRIASPPPSAPAACRRPRFEVDPLWPKPLPNHWVLGQTIGVAVDAQDHVWIVHRGDASLNIMTEGSNTQGPTWTVDERSALADVAGRQPRRHRHRRAGLPDHRRRAHAAGHRPPHRQRHRHRRR